MKYDLDQLCIKYKEGSISKDEFIIELQNMRAFTVSDRFKLRAIDASPFTLWASDKDDIIRYWECQCKRVYGYSADEAIGQNFLTLFVAEAERNEADKDAERIIAGEYKSEEFCNNIAGDIDKDGHVKRVMTNCFRVLDEITGEWLQAEIAVEANLDRITSKYVNIIATYKKLQSLITQSKQNFRADKDEIRKRVKLIQTLARRIIASRNKLQSLSEAEIEQVNSIPANLETLKDQALEALNKCVCSMIEAKSIDQFEQCENNYFECLENYNDQIIEYYYTLTEMSEALQQTAINELKNLTQEKSDAIDLCKGLTQIPKEKIKKIHEVGYRYLSDPAFSSIMSDVQKAVNEANVILEDIAKNLSQANQEIFNSTSSKMIVQTIEHFRGYIESICIEIDKKEIDKIEKDGATISK